VPRNSAGLFTGKTKAELDAIQAEWNRMNIEHTGPTGKKIWHMGTNIDGWIRLRVAYKELGLNMDGTPYNGPADFNAGPE
jgi:hypothetical protein